MRNSSLCVRKRSIKKLITRIDIYSTHHTTLCWLYIYAAASFNILKYCDSWQFTDKETRIYLSMVTFLAQADIGTLHQISLYPFLLSFKRVTLWRRHTPLYSTFCTLSLWNITLRFFLMPSLFVSHKNAWSLPPPPPLWNHGFNSRSSVIFLYFYSRR